MNNSSQWSIRQLLLLVVVAALLCSHLAGYYQRQIVGFTNFAVNKSSLMQWLEEADPTANSYASSSGTNTSADACDYEIDIHVSTKAFDTYEVLEHVRRRFESKAKAERWSIVLSGGDKESFELAVTKGATRFRVYGWLLPVKESTLGVDLEQNGQHTTRLKVLQVGYHIP